ncbi:MAG TPA: alginate lyase family protein [Longimicrobium sp.]|nr:alginate lyase family protein [Longimicrobium sp.]
MLAPRLWPEAAWTLYRTFGARGAALRARHEARRAAGAFRPAPRHAPGMATAGAVDAFVVDPQRLRAATDRAAAVQRADRVAAGEHQAFRWEWRPLPAGADGWLTHPVTGTRADVSLPWWRVAHLDAHGGDIKELWEAARFGWAYDLVRGWLVTGDERYAAAFHARLAEWCESSPPFRGPHWSCGQETAIRAAALLYAEANLGGAVSTDADARRRIEAVLAASGERIADAVGYAVSQRNNHALSEAMGLVALGARFRGAHPEADGWLRTGHRLLERLVVEQFAADGWYIQHSFTYLRLALDQCVVAERALRGAGLALSPAAAARLRAAADLLLAVIDPSTGEVPNHGNNDGAFVHPVTLAPYRDFRPVLTAVCALWRHPLPMDVEADAETLAWLGADPPPRAPAMADGVRGGASGWAVARTGGTVVFLRAGAYSSRPGHIDPLHLDVRVDGREVVVDPGTFAYNAPPPWRNGLAGAAVHNGPVLDDAPPGVPGPRFLWYIWPAARLLRAEPAPGGALLEAEVPGASRRTVRVAPGRVEVEDRVLRPGTREAAVRWLLHPGADAAWIRAPGARVVEADPARTAGWFSPGYGVRLPSRAVEVRWAPSGDAAVRTVITPPEAVPAERNSAESAASASTPSHAAADGAPSVRSSKDLDP